MDTTRRTRSCRREREGKGEREHGRLHRQLCVPITRQEYDQIWHDARAMRVFLNEKYEEHPELFPASMASGYELSGFLPESKKIAGIRFRQLRTGGVAYGVRPSFVMPYMSGATEKLDPPLFLYSLGVPYWALTRVFGHNDMYWHRHIERLGRNSIVGTTVQSATTLPRHLAADEHHADWCGEKGYIPMTVGGGCILGIALTSGADEESLTDAYSTFSEESNDLDPSYAPETINTDGWAATQNAFVSLFPTVTTILCFLHGFLKIKDRGRKLHDLHRAVWDVYRETTAEGFSSSMKGLVETCCAERWSPLIMQSIEKLAARVDQYAKSYAHPDCLRTSNMVDRLMNRLTRSLYHGRGIHGHQHSSELTLRGWALIQNFRDFAPRAGDTRSFSSPAHRLNQKRYHENWLQNLNISASRRGLRGGLAST